MTHPSKRFLIYVPIVLSLLIFFSYLFTLILFFSRAEVSTLYASVEPFLPSGVAARSVLWILLAQSAFVAFAVIVLFLFFRKTHSPEVFFFLFGLLGFAVQTSRFYMAPASLFTLSAYSLIPFTRLVYFGRLLTGLSFFASGLFASGFMSQRRNFYLSIIFLISFIISVTLPVDFTGTEGPLLFTTGEKTGFALAYYAINLFAVLNFVLAAYKHSELTYWYVSVAILLVIGGIELSFYFPYGVIASTGLLLTIGGTALFANRMHEIYLWV